jgi:hypothetical protein
MGLGCSNFRLEFDDLNPVPRLGRLQDLVG